MTIIPLRLQTHHFIPEPWLLKPQHQVLTLCSKGGTSGRVENRVPGSTSQWAKYFPAVSSRQIGTYHMATHSQRKLGKWTPGGKHECHNWLSPTMAFLLSLAHATEIRRSLPTNWRKVKKAGREEGSCPQAGHKVHLPRQQWCACQASGPRNGTSRFLDLGFLHGFLCS